MTVRNSNKILFLMIMSAVLLLKFLYSNSKASAFFSSLANGTADVLLTFSVGAFVSILKLSNEEAPKPCRHITHHLTPNINHWKTTCLQLWQLYVRYMSGVKDMPTLWYQGQHLVTQKEVPLSFMIAFTAVTSKLSQLILCGLCVSFRILIEITLN